MTKTLLITGATGDIGKELCEHFAKKHANHKDNYHLIITARTEKNLKNLAESLREKYQVPVSYFVTDFSDQNSFTELVEYATHQKLDGLVIMPPRPNPCDKLIPSDAELDQMLKISFRGPIKLINDLLPALQEGHKTDKEYFSHVILVSGMSSVQPLNNAFMFNALRTAWLGPMKTLADALGEHGVIFNTASFGQVLTETFLNKVDQEAKNNSTTREEILAKKVANVPLKKYASVQNAVKGISFFLKSEASDSITGQNLVIDNGFARKY